jgi:hypothetical protein
MQVSKIRGAYDGGWYPPLRWQAHLFDCKAHWREGRLAASARSAARSMDQARALLDERYGEWGVREHAFAVRTIAERAPRAVLIDAGITDAMPSRAPLSSTAIAPSMPSASASLVLLAGGAGPLRRELESELGAPVDADLAPGVYDWASGLVVFLPELLDRDALRSARDAIRASRRRHRRVLVASALRDDEIEGCRVGVRLVFEAAEGVRRRVGATAPSSECGHVLSFDQALQRERSGLRLGAAARSLIASYDWPGGASEIEAVASAVAAHAVREVSPDLLVSAGVAGSAARNVDDVTRAIVTCLEDDRPWSVTALERATGLPRRTLQRRLRALTEKGVLARTGKARAVRYRVASTQA